MYASQKLKQHQMHAVIVDSQIILCLLEKTQECCSRHASQELKLCHTVNSHEVINCLLLRNAAQGTPLKSSSCDTTQSTHMRPWWSASRCTATLCCSSPLYASGIALLLLHVLLLLHLRLQLSTGHWYRLCESGRGAREAARAAAAVALSRSLRKRRWQRASIMARC